MKGIYFLLKVKYSGEITCTTASPSAIVFEAPLLDLLQTTGLPFLVAVVQAGHFLDSTPYRENVEIVTTMKNIS